MKDTADRYLAAHDRELSTLTSRLFDLAEPAWREYESAALLVDVLRRDGWTVEEGSGGMPTAFCAIWSNGDGPTVAGYAEYDAVPGNCQAATTERRPRPGLSPYAPGHTDPHSALAIGALGGFMAAKAAMTERGIAGTLRFLGEPAEKVCGSKVVHGLRGYYDELAAMISYHPFFMLPLCNTVRWDTHCGAYYSRIWSFICDEPETWNRADETNPIAALHTAARAPGANAALQTMYATSKTTLESMLPHTGGWSLNEAILTAGQATADNLPAGLAQIQYAWRCPDLAMADQVLGVLERNAEHAAAIAHCRVAGRWVARNRPGVRNHAIATAAYANLERVGAPVYDDDARAAGRAVQTALGIDPSDDPFLPATQRLIDPLTCEEALRAQLPPWQRNWTSDDYVEMTWYAPTARIYIARPTLVTPPGAAVPHWAATALGGIPACIDPTVRCAARTIAGTVLDVLTDADLRARARREFDDRTGGEAHVPPQLPADFTAPLDYRWPEYVTTARGREWCIPANPEIDGEVVAGLGSSR